MTNTHTYYEAAYVLDTLIAEMGEYDLIDALYYQGAMPDIDHISITNGIAVPEAKCVKVSLRNGLTMCYEGQALIDLLSQVASA